MSAYYSIFESNDAYRMQSPRPETPEPFVIMGRRNPSVQLFDDHGNISEEFKRCLMHIFAKYCIPRPDKTEGSLAHGQGPQLLVPPPNAYFTPEALDQWAIDTSGAKLSEEVKELLDVTEEGNLPFEGFLQIYLLTTDIDEEETWRDLSSHGFDRTLTLVTTRREDWEDEDFLPRCETPQPNNFSSLYNSTP